MSYKPKKLIIEDEVVSNEDLQSATVVDKSKVSHVKINSDDIVREFVEKGTYNDKEIFQSIIFGNKITVYYRDDNNTPGSISFKRNELTCDIQENKYGDLLIDGKVFADRVNDIGEVRECSEAFQYWIEHPPVKREDRINLPATPTLPELPNPEPDIVKPGDDVPHSSEEPLEDVLKEDMEAYINQTTSVYQSVQQPTEIKLAVQEEQPKVEETKINLNVDNVISEQKKPKEYVVKINEDSIGNTVSVEVPFDDSSMGVESDEEMDSFWKKVDDKLFGTNEEEDNRTNEFVDENKVISPENVNIEYNPNESNNNQTKAISEEKIAEMNAMLTEKFGKKYIGYNDSKDLLFTSMRSKRTPVIDAIRDSIQTDKVQAAPIGEDAISFTSFMTTQVEPLMRPDIVTVPLLISGLSVNIAAFMYNDLSRVRHLIPEIRKVHDLPARNKALLEKRKLEIEIIYDHITAVKGFNQKPSYNEFLEMVMFSDLPQLFFGAYVATHSDEREYDVVCSSCHNTIQVNRSPKQLCEIVSNHITVEEAKKILNNTYTREQIENLEIVKTAKRSYVEKDILPKSGMILKTKIPTLREYLDCLEAMVSYYEDTDLNDVDFLSLYYNRDIALNNTETADEYFRRCLLYIDKLIIPKITFGDNDQVSTGFVEVKQKKFILDIMNKLHPDDFKAVIDSKNIKKMSSLRGIQHFIKLDECPHCNLKMEPFPFNSELIFFLEELETTLSQD